MQNPYEFDCNIIYEDTQQQSKRKGHVLVNKNNKMYKPNQVINTIIYTTINHDNNKLLLNNCFNSDNNNDNNNKKRKLY